MFCNKGLVENSIVCFWVGNPWVSQCWDTFLYSFRCTKIREVTDFSSFFLDFFNKLR